VHTDAAPGERQRDPPRAHAELERAPVPGELFRLAPRVRSRIGIDTEPVDVTRRDEALLLKAFVWPDQTWRLELVEQAVAAVRRERPRVIKGDAAVELPRLLRARRPDAVTLVYQTAVIGYMEPERRELVYAALVDAARDGALAYAGTHSPLDQSDRYYGLAVQTWPDGGAREVVAHADFHGAWIEWLRV
jgi:hypothetical protein